MNNGKYFIKGDDGHYRYVNKIEYKKSNKSLRYATVFFYLMVLLIFISVGYYIYTDIFEVYLVNKEISIDNGDYYQIELLPKNSKYFNYENYVYSTDNNDILSVDKFGGITAYNNGTANVSVRFKNGIEKKVLKVNVYNVDIKKISVDKSISINKNETKKIKVIVNNDENLNAKLNYKSSNEDIFVVDEIGNITGIGEGKATLKVSSSNGIEATSSITVKAVKEDIQQISIKEKSLELKQNKSKKLTLEIVPSSASTKSLTWKSSDPSIVSVDSNGRVTANKVGKAKITVKTPNGLDAISIVNVLEEDDIILNTYNEELYVGDSIKLTANIDCTFKSSDSKIASVDNNGNVKAISKGKATIFVNANGKETSCIINVKEKPIYIERIETIKSIDLYKGSTYLIKVTYSPNNATNKNITWSSSNSEVASVDSNGKVTANKVGLATITAKSSNGKISKTDVYVNNRVIEVESLSFDLKSIDIVEGKSIKISPIIKPSNATNKNITWSSEDESIATVDSNGFVKGIKSGKTKVIASSNNNKTATIVVNVKKVKVNVTSIKLNKNKVSLEVGKTDKLTATIYPSNATVKTVSWNSSNSKVVSVDQNGNIKALTVGTAYITATSSNGLTAKCDITVKDINISQIKLSSTNLNLKIGNTHKLTATISPSSATNKKLTWSSSNSNIASVDQNGNIKAISVGTATIEVKSNNGISAKCSVKVEHIKPTKIVIDEGSIKLVEGNTKQLNVTFSPKNVTDKSLSWTSSDEKVATVSSTGKVTAKKSGKAKITAKSKIDTNIKSEIIVTVDAKTIEVTSVSLDKTSANLEIGKTVKLNAIISPSNATNKSVKWTVSDNSIASVDKNGNVKGLKEGKTQVTVITNNNLKSSCIINVKKQDIKVTKVSIDSDISYIYIGNSATLSATISPENATNKSVKWTSSNDKIATVSSSGVVSGKKQGSVTITVTSNSNPNAKDTKTILIKEKPVNVTSVTLNKTEITINKGKTYTLTATIKPSNATNKKITWSTNNSKVAIVDSTGKVTAKGAGQTYIIAKTHNNIEAKCKVVVKDIVDVTSISLDTRHLALYKNDEYQLKATISPENATNKTITYSSSNTKVATVSSTGKVTAKSKGVAIITAKSNNGKSYSVNVVVFGSTVAISYRSSTLRYFVEKYNNYIVTRIWVKDAYNQMKVAMTKPLTYAPYLDKYRNCYYDKNRTYTMYSPSTASTIINDEIKNKKYSNKGLVAVNASAMVSSDFNSACGCDCYGTAAIPIVINDGKVIRKKAFMGCGHRAVYGLNKNYQLKVYSFYDGYNDSGVRDTSEDGKNNQLMNTIINEGVKYTFGFSGSLVKDGKVTSTKTDRNIRQGLGQIDKNNYILITDTTSDRNSGHSYKSEGEEMVSYGVKTAVRLDGGGSTSYYYKTNTSSATKYSTIYEGRGLADMLYFVEQ